jgi:hypothetical protein
MISKFRGSPRFVVMLWLTVLLFPEAARSAPPTIRRIEVVRHNVFEPGDLPFHLHGLLNSLHAVTVESAIRRDLLFAVGDRLDSFLVAESERVLRQRRYIAGVHISWTQPVPDSVDVKVETHDVWTFETSLSFSGGGGAYALSLAASERNFRGRAQEMGFGYAVSDRRSSGNVFLADPALFGSHLRGSVGYSTYRDGNAFSMNLRQPFWAATVPWGYGFSVSNGRDNYLFYKEGQSAFAYPYAQTGATADLARAWGRRVRLLAGVGISWRRSYMGEVYIYEGTGTEFLADTALFTRPDEIRAGPSLGVRIERQRYLVGHFLDQFGKAEDFPTTLAAGLRAASYSKVWGSTLNRTQLGGQVQAGLKLGPAWTNAEVRLYWDSDAEGHLGSTQVAAAWRLYLQPAPRHTFVAHLRHDGWYRANYFGQMYIGTLPGVPGEGNASGVRGLPARIDDGTRRWVGNFEYRYFSPLRILTVDLGGVVFTDVGQVWDETESLEMSRAPWTYGFGLRLGFSKIAGERIFRMDWARGPEGWITTFGFGMYLSFNLDPSLGF